MQGPLEKPSWIFCHQGLRLDFTQPAGHWPGAAVADLNRGPCYFVCSWVKAGHAEQVSERGNE